MKADIRVIIADAHVAHVAQRYFTGRIDYSNETSLIITTTHPDNCNVSFEQAYVDLLQRYGVDAELVGDDVTEEAAVGYAYKLWGALAKAALGDVPKNGKRLIVHGSISISAHGVCWEYSDTTNFEKGRWYFPSTNKKAA